jgi:transposase InsO family protein
VKYAWIAEHRQQFEVEAMCQVLEVSKSGFYAAQARPPSARQIRRAALLAEIKNVHAASRGRYGSPRVYQELKARQVQACENTIAKVMRAAAIRAKTCRKYVPCTTDARHAFPIAENRLNRDFKAEAPNRRWVTDITYIPTGEGWLYLAGVIDLFSRKLVGWSMADNMQTKLVEDALKMALARRQTSPGLLHHSDRGSQYACGDYQKLLLAHGLECSMSRAGNCYDNAVMESFWGTLKKELVYHEKYATREQARRSIFEYIEVFYNRVRRHSSLGYLSPEAFEAGVN